MPAEAPTGENVLSVRLSWLRPDDSRLPARRWIFPTGDSLDLGAPVITHKKNRSFEKPTMQTETAVNFENKAALIGYDLPVSYFLPATSPLSLTLYWQGLGEIRHSYAIFVHLVDDAGNVVAQQDAIPGERGKQPTTSWAPGEYIVDPVGIALPTDLPPGDYSVVVGLYLPPSGPRLLRLDDAGQAVGDSAVLGFVKIE